MTKTKKILAAGTVRDIEFCSEYALDVYLVGLDGGMLSNPDPDLEGRYDPWEDDYEPSPRYVPAEPYDSAYREKEALEAMGYRVP